MALTPHQRAICRLIAANRIAQGETYVAGGVALNEVLGARRLSLDIDLFHDTDEAVARTWSADRALLEGAGFEVASVRERPAFVEATVRKGEETSLVQWVRESAFRFFPLVEHVELGVTLHPFDLASNKVLALVGRLEVRDWVDVIECDRRLQPLGYMAWAACGKDPGFNPASILAEATRTGRYTSEEIATLAFDGPPPDAGALARRWHEMLKAAREIIAALPAEEAGTCVLDRGGRLYRGSAADLVTASERGGLVFHRGTIRGALPRIG